jgi:glycolate oxidase FAD binding subunit
MKLLTGSYGTLGIVTEATLRLYPLPAEPLGFLVRGTSEELKAFSAQLLDSTLTPAVVDVLYLANQLHLWVEFHSGSTIQAQKFQELAQGLACEARPQRPKFTDDSAILLKIGTLPSQTIPQLIALNRLVPGGHMLFHRGSGLGYWWLPQLTPEQLTQARQIVNGFVSVLKAPLALKKTVNIWDFRGNTLPLMYQIKAQFDPGQKFSPGRLLP